MTAKTAMAQRLVQALEMVTLLSVRASETEAYGSWLLGQESESSSRRRVRIKRLVIGHILGANLTGLVVGLLVLTFAFPVPSIYTDAPWWVSFAVAPAYCTIALTFGTNWMTTRIVTPAIRWATEERRPSQADVRNTLLLPWRVAVVHIILWGFGAVFLATLYGLANPVFIPVFLGTGIVFGVAVATNCYLFTEFALRPVAAQALDAGQPPRRLAAGIVVRTMTVWTLGSGIPVAGIAVTAFFALLVEDLTKKQLGVAVGILAVETLIFGSLLMWTMSWATAAPVRAVRAALKRVEHGDLRDRLVVFDGTELGELQRGFNAMVDGLRERERVRDLFGRHVGREVAAAAERERSQLGGEELHVAIVFIDIIGSTQLVTSRPATEVVQLLNRFFAIIVDEVDRHRGLVNKFAGDAALAIFGAPNHLNCPEDEALAAARHIAERLAGEISECQAGIGVAAGQVVAGNIGANERFEYTVIGRPVNEAARLCELAKSRPDRLLASSEALDGASQKECAHWSFGEEVTLRGYNRPTRLASPGVI